MKKKRRIPPKTISKSKTIFLLAEGTGETVSKIANASLAQFDRKKVVTERRFQVTSTEQIREQMEKLADEARVEMRVGLLELTKHLKNALKVDPIFRLACRN